MTVVDCRYCRTSSVICIGCRISGWHGANVLTTANSTKGCYGCFRSDGLLASEGIWQIVAVKTKTLLLSSPIGCQQTKQCVTTNVLSRF
eukprot:scaffold51757_cov42-Cyclotella_meneghiniana.AAC.17